MATKPDNEQRDLTLSDHGADHKTVGHPHESPDVWGWHGEWGKWSRVGGWVSAIILLLMMTSTHYNEQGTLFLGLSAVGLIVALIWDRQRRRHSWRQ